MQKIILVLSLLLSFSTYALDVNHVECENNRMKILSTNISQLDNNLYSHFLIVTYLKNKETYEETEIDAIKFRITRSNIGQVDFDIDIPELSKGYNFRIYIVSLNGRERDLYIGTGSCSDIDTGIISLY